MYNHKTIQSLIANTLNELNHKEYYDDDPKIHSLLTMKKKKLK